MRCVTQVTCCKRMRRFALFLHVKEGWTSEIHFQAALCKEGGKHIAIELKTQDLCLWYLRANRAASLKTVSLRAVDWSKQNKSSDFIPWEAPPSAKCWEKPLGMSNISVEEDPSHQNSSLASLYTGTLHPGETCPCRSIWARDASLPARAGQGMAPGWRRLQTLLHSEAWHPDWPYRCTSRTETGNRQQSLSQHFKSFKWPHLELS